MSRVDSRDEAPAAAVEIPAAAWQQHVVMTGEHHVALSTEPREERLARHRRIRGSLSLHAAVPSSDWFARARMSSKLCSTLTVSFNRPETFAMISRAWLLS